MSGFVGQPILAAAGFKPAFGLDYTCGKPPSKWTPLSISLIGPGRTGPVPPLKRRLQARLPAPQCGRPQTEPRASASGL